MCVAVVALSYLLYVLLLLSLFIVKLRLSTPNKVYDHDVGDLLHEVIQSKAVCFCHILYV